MSAARLLAGRLAAFRSDRRGASAVEFSLVATPFIYMLLGILQIGIFYMTQAALDAGVIKTADALRNGFTNTATPSLPTGTVLKGTVATNSGALVTNDATLSVEIRPMSALGAASVPVADGYTDYGTVTSTLAIRAKATVMTFAPGLGSLTLASSAALVRRQGQ